MATKKFYQGSRGPFLYDDTNSFPDGTPHGIYSEGIIRTENAPSVPEDVLRLGDVGSGVAPHDAQYVVLSASPDLTNERVLAAGDFISLTDGGAGLAVTLDVDVKDEDDMASNSALHLATQQSIKAYVDGQAVGALNDLTDVSIGAVGDNELLAYDAASGEWINQTAAEAGLEGSGGSVYWQNSVLDKDLTTPPA